MATNGSSKGLSVDEKKQVAGEISKYQNRNQTKYSAADNTRRESISFINILCYTIISTNIKIVLQFVLGDSLQKYPHFQTPYSSLSNVKEAINHHRQNGTYYYADPNSINQSVLVIKAIDYLLQIFNDSDQGGVFVFFYIVDFMITFVQFQIIDKIWTQKKHVQQYEVNFMMMLIFFNPLHLSSPSAQNVGVVKDLLCYLTLYLYIEKASQTLLNQIIQAAVIGTTFYVDPSSWSLHVGLIFCSTKQNNPLSVLFSIATILFWMIVTGADINEQWQNIVNILTLKDHSENIGVYFYISIEVFKQHVDFFKTAYLIFTTFILLQIRQIVRKAYAVVALATQHDVEKYERRIFRIKCNTIFMVTFVKVVLNQYPLLIDIQVFQFLLVCCNMRFSYKYLEAQLLMACLITFSILNTLFLWITWLDRFSGNANFFYFQAVVYNLWLIIIFIQFYNGVNAKIFKYQKQMEEIKKERQKKFLAPK